MTVTAKERQELREKVDAKRREQIAKAHGRDLHVPAWDDERAWARIEGKRP